MIQTLSLYCIWILLPLHVVICATDDGDFVNIKALSELHMGLGSSRTYEASSGDYGNNIDGNGIEQTSTTLNSIEQFLLRRKQKLSMTTMPDKFYEEIGSLPSSADVISPTETSDVTETSTIFAESETTTPVNTVSTEESTTETPVTKSLVDMKKAPMIVDDGNLIVEPKMADDNDTEQPSITLIQQTNRYASLSCYECYGCKTYFIKKIRRCPRNHDMCVKEVSVGRRLAINGRNLIEIEINQYCSTGECPRSDGNVTFACCYSHLCNNAVKFDGIYWLIIPVIVSIACKIVIEHF